MMYAYLHRLDVAFEQADAAHLRSEHLTSDLRRLENDLQNVMYFGAANQAKSFPFRSFK